MKPLASIETLSSRPDVIRQKRIFGMIYGIMAGLAFAVSSWGWDGYSMSQAHAYFPWNVLITGAVLCGIFGGIIGWLTARMESSLIGIVFWLLGALFFAWLTVALPLQIAPVVASKFDPQLSALLNYDGDIEFASRFGVALAWILPFTVIIGIAQLPVMEPAAFSTSIFGKIAPLLFGMAVISIGGVITDSLINAQFRGAVLALDKTIQFVLDNKDNEGVDPLLAREMHARAFATVEDDMQETRYLVVGSFDETLGDINVLVKFDKIWVMCEVLYNQPISCKPAAPE
jgi:hypothetical protein